MNYTQSLQDGFQIAGTVSLILLIVGVTFLLIQIIVFFKFVSMLDDVRAIRDILEGREIDIATREHNNQK